MGSVESRGAPKGAEMAEDSLIDAPVHVFELLKGAGRILAVSTGWQGCAKATQRVFSPPLEEIAECYQPIFSTIAGYAAGSPGDMAHLSGVSPCFGKGGLEATAESLWARLYALRWPAFYDCLRHHGAKDWRRLYRETLQGQVEVTLEVFVREKKRDFAMSAMPARVVFHAKHNLYIARYLSASKVLPEGIPVKEEQRLRFCPASACGRLLPSGVLEGSASLDKGRAELGRETPPEERQEYPYRVLGHEGELVVGEGVELQWKMQQGSPFAWWYGHLESVRRSDDGSGLVTAQIIFRHFPENSRWHRLDVRFGDGHMHCCDFGGFTGGLRAVSNVEKKRWMQFFPQDEVHV